MRERLTRVRPNAASRLRIRRLNAGWVTKRRSAAWEKLRVAAKALKSSSHLLSRFIKASRDLPNGFTRSIQNKRHNNIMPFMHRAACNSIGCKFATSLALAVFRP
ncbi:hypothetical protein D9M73_224760 [compost metagenome]